MKYITCIVCLLVLTCITLTIQSKGAVHIVTGYKDTVRVIKEYGPDSILLSIRQQEMISGCWKEVQYRQYDKSGLPVLQRNTSYAKAKANTCDFTPYIEHSRRYKNGKLVEESFRQAACDECDANPCGISSRYNRRNKLVYSKDYGKCSFQHSRYL